MTPNTAWVTGSTSGFGAAIAWRLVQGGWRVVISGRRAERLDELAQKTEPGKVHVAAFDMRDDAAMQAAIDGLPADFANIDLLVNNAGLALGTAPAQDADLDQWRQMIDTNITALVSLTRRLLPGLIERKGTIVNISSISGSYPYAGGNVYGASKAFVTQFSNNLRVDLHGTGVRVSNIEPGLAETEFTLVRTGGDHKASDTLYSGADPITATDIADTVHWIVNQPPHLNINRVEIMPVSQSAAGLQVARKL